MGCAEGEEELEKVGELRLVISILCALGVVRSKEIEV
jgi:hypothetical protein